MLLAEGLDVDTRAHYTIFEPLLIAAGCFLHNVVSAATTNDANPPPVSETTYRHVIQYWL